MMWIATALAQEGAPVDAESFRASSDARRTVVTDEASITAGWAASAAVHYQRSPFGFESEDGSYTHLVRDAVALDLAGAFAVGPLRLGLTAPVYLVVTSDVDPNRTVLGDAGLHVKLRPVHLSKGAVDANIAFLGSLDLPLGAAKYYLGSSLAGRLGVAADVSAGKGYFALNGGVHLQQPQELENARIGHQVFIRGAIGVQVIERFAIALEGFSRVNLLPDSTFDSTFEMLLGAHRTGPGVSPYGSVGTAITPGIGSPVFRAVLGVRVAPAAD